MRAVLTHILVVFILSAAMGCHKNTPDDLVLFDFETEKELDQVHWKCRTLLSLSGHFASHGKKSLRIEMFPSSYPGFSPALAVNDWQGYKFFCFDIFNPSPDHLKITLRVDDRKQALEYNERYNQSFDLKPGLNSFKIPLSTLKTSQTGIPLKLKKICRFLLFMVNPDKKQELFLDHIRLCR